MVSLTPAAAKHIPQHFHPELRLTFLVHPRFSHSPWVLQVRTWVAGAGAALPGAQHQVIHACGWLLEVLEEEELFGVPSPRLLPRVSNSAVPLGSDSSCCHGLLCASCSLHLVCIYQGNPAKGVLSSPFYRRKVESWKVQFLAPQIPLLVSIWAVFREFASRGRPPPAVSPLPQLTCETPQTRAPLT